MGKTTKSGGGGVFKVQWGEEKGGGGAKLQSTQELCLMTLKIDTKFE